jgi:hypothetical protein
MMNVAKKMREILPILKKGVGEVPFPGLKPQVEENWSKDYASVGGMFYEADLFVTHDYFNHDKLREDFEKLVCSHFPKCGVTFWWGSQEFEVSQKNTLLEKVTAKSISKKSS